MTTTYHVFSDNYDSYHAVYDDAKKDYDQLVAEGNNARLYEETWTEGDDADVEEENCLESFGDWPM